MGRRTLEAIGKDFDPNAKSVFEGLKKMKDAGIISDELHEWSDLLRKYGNIGAHATETEVSEQDGKEMMEFLDAIIETIYSLRPRFKAMRDRHQSGQDAPARSVPPPPPPEEV